MFLKYVYYCCCSVIKLCLTFSDSMLLAFSQQIYWGNGLPFPPPVDHILSELSTMTCTAWISLHGMAHSFIELCKPLHHNKAVIYEEGSHILYTIYIYIYIYTYIHTRKLFYYTWGRLEKEHQKKKMEKLENINKIKYEGWIWNIKNEANLIKVKDHHITQLF